MRFVFSAQFLKVQPPETSFAGAWESLCHDLLTREHPGEECVRLGPPDRGIDILHRSRDHAIQCKSDERGAFGTVPYQASIDSLRTAVTHQASLGWKQYSFATNADYSGTGVEAILSAADALKVPRTFLKFLGPNHWSDLCEKHLDGVRERLDYRLVFTEEQVLDAFRNARYVEERVREFEDLLKRGAFRIELSNNLSPLRLVLPFSPGLTVKHCLDVASSILGIDLNGQTYGDLQTSAKPRISITIDRRAQPFDRKLSEFSPDELSRLEFWITIVWEDDLEARRKDTEVYRTRVHDLAALHLDRPTRRARTLEQFKASLQGRMWAAADALRPAGPR